MDVSGGQRGAEQVPPPVLPNNRRDSGLESSRSSFMRGQVRFFHTVELLPLPH